MLFLPWVASTQAVRNDLSRSLLTCILILYRVIWYLSYIDILVYTWWIVILYIHVEQILPESWVLPESYSIPSCTQHISCFSQDIEMLSVLNPTQDSWKDASHEGEYAKRIILSQLRIFLYQYDEIAQKQADSPKRAIISFKYDNHGY